MSVHMHVAFLISLRMINLRLQIPSTGPGQQHTKQSKSQRNECFLLLDQTEFEFEGTTRAIASKASARSSKVFAASYDFLVSTMAVGMTTTQATASRIIKMQHCFLRAAVCSFSA
jgi:hypothetical protein